jgi:hypothetical protein
MPGIWHDRQDISIESIAATEGVHSCTEWLDGLAFPVTFCELRMTGEPSTRGGPATQTGSSCWLPQLVIGAAFGADRHHGTRA